jgi:hypothetical protein
VRRVTIVAVRALLLIALLAAAFDVSLPGGTPDRVRIHLVDRSDSVKVKVPGSLDLKDADEIIAHDRDTRSGGDTVTWASFGKNVAFESKNVDSSGSDLAGALAAALARNPTEILLYSDGRTDPGTSLFLCRERGVPVHVLPIGPTTVRDVRFTRIAAPATVPAGEPYGIEVVVQSTYDVRADVRLDTDVRTVSLVAGVPATLIFPRKAPGKFQVDIDVDDACPENNHAVGEVFSETDKPRVLAISTAFPQLPEVDMTVAPRPTGLGAYDAVILDSVPLSPADQETLAAWVEAGGGLVLLGGKASYASGGWQRSPLERISPLKVFPDLKLAAVLGIDVSGSMKPVYERAVAAILDARSWFDSDDDLVAMTFAETAEILDFGALRRVTPTGGTRIARGIAEARKHLKTRNAGRKIIVLMTDGESAAEETPDMLRAEIQALEDIGLIVITTSKEVPGARNFPLSDWKSLGPELTKVTQGMKEVYKESPGLIDLRAHPVTAGVQPVPLKEINRTTAKPDAQVLATVGVAPKQDPVLALRPAGRGRVAAFTIPYDPALARLFRQAIASVMGNRDGGLTLTIEPPLVIARGTSKEVEFRTEGLSVEMKQVGPQRWEGRLPAGLTGNAVVRKGRSRATATIACPPELAALGIDRPALDRIAGETGGRVLQSLADLATLPRPTKSAPRSGRNAFLLSALALVFVELAVSVYWKV